MKQYRYRTCVLTGPWRSTREEAVDDAIRSRQAALREGGEGLDWLVPGRIEQAFNRGGIPGTSGSKDGPGSD